MTTLSLNRNYSAKGFVRQSKTAAPSTTPQVPTLMGLVTGLFTWLKTRNIVKRSEKRLETQETLSLGEKRFVAVIKVDGREFLIGGAENSISILSELAPAPKFTETLTQASIVAKPRLKNTAASLRVLPAVAAKVAPSPSKSAKQRKRKAATAQVQEQA